MKRLIQTLILMLAVVTLPAIANAKKKATKEVTYKVELDCHTCVDKVMKNIPYEKGVKDVKASIENQEVKIVFVEEKNSAQNLKKALEKLGFKAELKNHTACHKDKSSCNEHKEHEHKHSGCCGH